jgi:hypothetical protein
MTSNVFWGLTNTDLQNCFFNDIGAAKVFFAGAAVAGVVTFLALKFLNRRDPGQAALKHSLISLGIGTIAGSCVSFYFAYHSAPITVAAEKALKFLALTFVMSALGSIPAKKGAVLGLLTFGGGVWPVFGRTPLYYVGLFGAISGASFIAGSHS